MPGIVTRARLWLRSLIEPRRFDQDLSDELRFHLDARARELTRRGLPPDEAARRARLEFGNSDNVRDDVRGVRRGLWVEQLLQDVRYAVRMCRRFPGFNLVAVGSLALGIGTVGAVFSAADALLLRPLPVSSPEAIVTLGTGRLGASSTYGGVSFPNYRDFREATGTLNGLVAYHPVVVSFARDAGSLRDVRTGLTVSENFFDVLGVRPVIGRSFLPQEGVVPGRDAVMVLGHRFWSSTLAADPGIVNTTVWVNDIAFTVIGVAPPEFTGMDPTAHPAFYLPVQMSDRLTGTPASSLEDRQARTMIVKGRLRPGVSIDEAKSELRTVWAGLTLAYPAANDGLEPTLFSELEFRILREPIVSDTLARNAALMTIVLLVACTNVAGLLLGRARSRSREMAIRSAIGIGRWRLIRQLLTEGLVLAAGGGVAGVGVALAGVRILATGPPSPDAYNLIVPSLDFRVLGVSLVATLGCAVALGLAPAWPSLRTRGIPLRSSSGLGGPRSEVGRSLLVGAQLALSTLLLIAAVVFVDSVRRSATFDPGFRTDHLLMATLDTSMTRYTGPETEQFYEDLTDRVEMLPGVVSVALTSDVPLDRGGSVEIVAPEGYVFPPGQDATRVFSATVDEHYFDTMRTDIVRGRSFSPDDDRDAPLVAIVNETFANLYWPNQDAVGQRLRLETGQSQVIAVVGVARTGKYLWVGESPRPFLYLPFDQRPRGRMSLLVETASTDAAALAGPVRAVVSGIDVRQPMVNMRTVSDFYDERATAVLARSAQTIGAAGGIGLALALVGLYAMVSYGVTRQTRELGLRMALGADRSAVLRMVLVQGLRVSGAGVLVGGLATVAVLRALTAAVAGLGSPHPAVLAAVPVALVSLTVMASYVPARRASRTDPTLALRTE